MLRGKACQIVRPVLVAISGLGVIAYGCGHGASNGATDGASSDASSDAGTDAPPFVGDFGKTPDAWSPPVESCTLAYARPAAGVGLATVSELVQIYADCSVMGSPSTEPQRDPATEVLAPHHRLSDFAIGRTEVTRAQWKAVGFAVPDDVDAAPSSGCTDDTCPVDAVTWQEALAFANARSVAEKVPPCFDLTACTGTPGSDFACSSTPLASGTDVYACKGYRLPTAYEWEIAARGNTLTWQVTPAPPSVDAGCWDLTSLDPIAWYCNNADGGLHPVASRDAGMTGPQRIWDMFGNAAELVFDAPHPAGYAAELYDPGGVASPTATVRYVKGGSFADPAAFLRPASLFGTQPWTARVHGVSFRIARTVVRTAPDP